MTTPADTELSALDDGIGVRGRFRWPASMRRPLAVAGLVIVACWVVIALTCQWWTANPLAQVYPPLQAPSAAHWFGTDELGRDVFSRTLASAKTSLPLSLLLVVCAMVVGGVLGAIAGYFGRFVDELIMRLTDIAFAFPSVILAMAVAAVLGPSLTNAVIAMLVVTWPSYCRVTRSLVLGQRQREYVVVGRLLGASPWQSLRRDVFPNVIGSIVVLATLDVGTALLLLSGLGYLGLGAVPPTPDWGLMTSEGVQNITSWWIALFPGMAIFSVVLAFNFIGDALRDSLDPRTRDAVQDRGI